MQMHDILGWRMWGTRSQTESMCVGRQLGLPACQNQGGGRGGDHLPHHHSPFLIPGPNSRPACLQVRRKKKREHGTMPHVRDVRKPKHSSALGYLIWFIKLQFAISVESSVSVKRENKRAQLNRRQEKQSPRLESVATGWRRFADRWTVLLDSLSDKRANSLGGFTEVDRNVRATAYILTKGICVTEMAYSYFFNLKRLLVNIAYIA